MRWLPRPNPLDVAYSIIGLILVSQVRVSHGDDVAFISGFLMVLSYFAGGVKYRPERWVETVPAVLALAVAVLLAWR